MSVVTILSFIIIGLLCWICAIKLNKKIEIEATFAVLCIISFAIASMGAICNLGYLEYTDFEHNQVYTIRGEVTGYSDDVLYIHGNKLDMSLIDDSEKIVVGGEVKAKVVFCPSGKIGVLYIE